MIGTPTGGPTRDTPIEHVSKGFVLPWTIKVPVALGWHELVQGKTNARYEPFGNWYPLLSAGKYADHVPCAGATTCAIPVTPYGVISAESDIGSAGPA